MEHIPLAEYLAQNSPMPLDMAMHLLLPVFQKARQAEQHRRILLRIYPANIDVLPENGRATLKNTNYFATVDGYSAPEQYRKYAQIGGFTAVYQLGALLYHALCGHPLPDANTRLEDDSVARDTIYTLPIWEREKGTLQKSIQLNPSERYASVNDMMAALEAIHAPMMEPRQPAWSTNTEAAFQPESEYPEDDADKKRSRKVAAIACILIVLVIAGAFTYASINQWNHAMTFLEQRNFEEAHAILRQLPDIFFPNHRQMLNLAEAGIAYENSEYGVAFEKLKGLDTFAIASSLLEKSTEKLLEALYMEAETQIREGNITAAGKVYTSYFSRYNFSPAQRDAINYERAVLYSEYEYYDYAIGILVELGDYRDAQELIKDAEIATAIQIAGEDDPLNVHFLLEILLETYPDDAKILERMEALIPGIYTQGVDYFELGNTVYAEECFTISIDYLDSQDYLTIMSAASVFELLPYLGTPYVNEKVYNYPMIDEYLTGRWRGDGRYFNLEDKADTTYAVSDLPWTSGVELYHLSDGILYLTNSSDTEESECFKFSFISADEMEIYAYANERTYRMTRR